VKIREETLMMYLRKARQMLVVTLPAVYLTILMPIANGGESKKPDAKDAAKLTVPDEKAYTALLGSENAKGWKHLGDGGFKIKDGVATSYGGKGVFVYAARRFADFVLVVEFKQDKADADSGVLLRFPDPKGDANAPAMQGYQVEIYKAIEDSNQGMAAIDNCAKPINNVPAKKPGEWNSFEIICIGQTYLVRLNGVLTTVFHGNRAAKGYIGLQNHDPTSIVHFRNVRILELPSN